MRSIQGKVVLAWVVGLLVCGCGPTNPAPGTIPSGCDQGAIGCFPDGEGQAVYTCQQDTWVKYESCEFGCVTDIGCTVCTPFQSSCDGGVEHICRADGSGFDDNECDPVQGMACDTAAGRCGGDCSLTSLGASYVGCEYYPTITDNTLLFGDFTFGVIVANAGDTDANIRLERVGGGSPDAFVLAARGVEVRRLPMEQDAVYRLRSDQPVVAYQFNPLDYFSGTSYSYTNDASLLLPRNALGRDYMVAAWPTWSGFGGLVAITAAQDDTKVTISTTAYATPFGSPGESFTRTLQRGELLQLLSASTASGTTGDLTGTRVTADKPVQVIGGHNCTNIPMNITACDHIEEVLFPVNTLRDAYVTTSPQALSVAAPYIVRVVADEDDTEISYAPAIVGAATQLDQAGEFIEFQTDRDVEITSNKPILVMQYMLGADLVGTGDPAMALAAPIEQWRNDYLFHAPVNYATNYVNVVAPTGASVLLDGLPVVGFEPVGATGWAVARVALDNSGDGNHEMTSSEKFGISVYGYGDYTSYWYPGGLDLEPVAVE